MAKKGRTPEQMMKRMGEPSWLILSVLHPIERMPAFEIAQQVNQLLANAGRGRALDPSTLSLALERMTEDELVDGSEDREVDVPAGRGATYRAPRPTYVITPAGAGLLQSKADLARAIEEHRKGKGMRPATVGAW